MQYLFLAVSLLILGVGPLLVVLAKRAQTATVFVDAFVLVVVGGLVALHVFPESIALGGWAAVVAAIVGAIFPILVEHGMRPAIRTRGAAILLALAGLAGHAMIDGAALVGVDVVGHGHAHHGHDHDHAALGTPVVWAVIAHRLPVGIAIWWIVGRTLGTRVALATLGVVVVGTLAGFFLGAEILTHASARGIGIFQGLLAGSLLHVVLHAHVPPPRGAARPRWHVASLVGALAAVGAVFAVEWSHEHAVEGVSAGDVFVGLALESAPVLLLAYLLAGFAHAFAPRAWIARVNRGSTFGQALRGIAVGMPLPVCSCGVVPIYRGLVSRGTGIAAAVAFLIATPELEVAAVLITWELMGPELAVARVVAAAALALLVALVVARAAARGAQPRPAVDAVLPADELAGATLGGRVRGALRVGLVDIVDQTSPWILAGLGLSAILAPHLTPAAFDALPAGVDVLLAAALGMPLYVCASGSTPLAAVFLAHGLSPGAAIAFLLTGPATNATTFGVLSGAHGRRIASVFAVAVFAGAVLLGYAVDLVVGELPSPLAVADLHRHASPLEIASVAVFAVLVLGSLLRRGTRRYVESLFDTPSGDESAHACGHEGP